MCYKHRVNVAHYSFNRTSMELKLFVTNFLSIMNFSFNRTSMELKLPSTEWKHHLPGPFNRTSMELKYECGGCRTCYYTLLIAPVWN